MNIGQLIAERGKPFYSFEFFPPKDPDQWPDFFKMAERLAPLEPLFTSVTSGAGGSSQDATLEIVSHLKKEFQFETMAHLTCGGATQEHITQYLQRLRDNGVDNVLALRGDIPKGQDIDWETAEFRHAADLVRFAKAHYPDMGIGVAGYPAPHPESPSFASDWRYTVAKIREGADFVITQLFFDVREYLHFVDRLSDMGVSIPVIPGILPIQSFDSCAACCRCAGPTSRVSSIWNWRRPTTKAAWRPCAKRASSLPCSRSVPCWTTARRASTCTR